MNIRRQSGSRRRAGGFTLIELLISVSIFLVLAVGAAALFTNILKIQVKDKLTQDAQRESDLVLDHMTRQLREGVRLEPFRANGTVNSTELAFRLKNNGLRRYYVSGGTLHYVSETGQDETLLAPGTGVYSYTWQPTSDASQNLQQITIRGTLSRTKGNVSVTVSGGTTVSTRPQ